MRAVRSTIRTAIVARNRSFGSLWTGQLLSGLGNWLLIVAVPVYVFRVTASSTDTGLATVAETLPLVALGPFAGVFADRWSRRRIMIGTNLLAAVFVALLLLASGRGQLWLILLAIFAESCAGAFFGPAYRGVVPAVVGRGQDLDAANAWSAISGGIVRLAGAPLGGVLYAVGGFRLPVALDAASYLVAALSVWPVRVARPPGRRRPADSFGLAAARAIVREQRAGVSSLRADRVLTVLLTASALFLLGNGALTALLVPYVVADLGVRAANLGELFSALGAGYLLSAYLGRRACASPRLRGSAVSLLALVTAAFAGMFNIHDFASALVFVWLAGMAGGAYLMFEQTLLQRRAADAVIGRISSAFSAVTMAATLVGALLASLLVTWAGRSTAANLAIAAVGCGCAAAGRLPATVTGLSATAQVPDPAAAGRLPAGPGVDDRGGHGDGRAGQVELLVGGVADGHGAQRLEGSLRAEEDQKDGRGHPALPFRRGAALREVQQGQEQPGQREPQHN